MAITSLRRFAACFSVCEGSNVENVSVATLPFDSLKPRHCFFDGESNAVGLVPFALVPLTGIPDWTSCASSSRESFVTPSTSAATSGPKRALNSFRGVGRYAGR